MSTLCQYLFLFLNTYLLKSLHILKMTNLQILCNFNMLSHTLDINQFQEKFTMNYSYFDSNSTKYLMCIHGITRNCRDFDYLAAILSTHYKIICPDMVGRE